MIQFDNFAIYLATPYTHDDPAVMQERVDLTKKVVVDMYKQGHIVICPVVQFQNMADDLPKDAVFWDSVCNRLVRTCDELHVLMLPGWQASKGTTAEIEVAQKHNIPIKYIQHHPSTQDAEAV